MFSVPLNARKVVYGECYLCMCMRAYLSVFSIQEFIHHRLVPGEYEHSSCKARGSPDVPKETQLGFSQKRPKRFQLNFTRL
jgi:hypothetical protein